MDRSKVMDKIAKCLNLGKSPNEHEAAAGMRQAQKLMAQYDISERELGAIGYTHEKVQTAIQAGKVVPIGLSMLVMLVGRAFGVRPVITRETRVSDVNFTILYFGQEHRAALASYTHVVIYRALESAWKKHLCDNPHLKGVVGVRAGFQAGWLESVRSTVEDFVQTDEEVTGTNLAVDNHFGRELSKAKTSNHRISGNAMNAGAEAGAGFKLHRPVNGSAAPATLAIGN